MPPTVTYLNDSAASLAAGARATLTFPLAAGGVYRLVGATFFTAAAVPVVEIEELRYIPWGLARPQDVLFTRRQDSGMNIAEFAGTGQLPRIFPVQDRLRGDQQVEMIIANRGANLNVPLSITLVFQLVDELDNPPENPTFMRILNDTKVLAAASEDNFVMTIPQGNVGVWRQMTGFIFNTVAGTEGSTDIFVKGIQVVHEGEQIKTDLLDGEMNFNELIGNARFTRIMEVAQRLKPGSDIVLRLRNDENVNMRLSSTAWVEASPVPVNV